VLPSGVRSGAGRELTPGATGGAPKARENKKSYGAFGAHSHWRKSVSNSGGCHGGTAKGVARKKFRRGFKFLRLGPRSRGREAPTRTAEGRAGGGCREGVVPSRNGGPGYNPRKIF
jgi:hypothetical protein